MADDYPDSCCESYDYQVDFPVCATYHRYGCLNRMKFIISQAAIIIATGATTVALVQVCTIAQVILISVKKNSP